ncbi:MAG TPA: hypothetical protein VM328_06600 [Fimbriimonadaceae bacterium]|nr:hypothetical protein [Fimbriimonadaceae bacterium]
MKKFLLVAVAVLAASATTLGLRQVVVSASIARSTGKFQGCGQAGSGGDFILNALKNRDRPGDEALGMTLDQVRDAPFPLALSQGEKDRARWSPAALEEIVPWEDRYALIEGYLIFEKKMGKESCNCDSATNVDWHLNLDSQPRRLEAGKPVLRDSMVVEVSPRTLAKHPSWSLATLRNFVRDGTRVRIKGWLLWDQEHHEQLQASAGADAKRATLWEIHPVHAIEYWDGNAWRVH